AIDHGPGELRRADHEDGTPSFLGDAVGKRQETRQMTDAPALLLNEEDGSSRTPRHRLSPSYMTLERPVSRTFVKERAIDVDAVGEPCQVADTISVPSFEGVDLGSLAEEACPPAE